MQALTDTNSLIREQLEKIITLMRHFWRKTQPAVTPDPRIPLQKQLPSTMENKKLHIKTAIDKGE